MCFSRSATGYNLFSVGCQLGTLYHVRSITLIPVGAREPIIFAKNGQSHKRAPAIVLSCGASKLNTETGSPARPTIIVEKLTVKLDAQQLMGDRSDMILPGFFREL